ncbi:MAG: hypothetical protein MUE66_09340 [Acidimicrobiia bacterium]|jgi:hypothetical protein|nr:hypothetical protein [Acidimicrobiia bacterium]
MAENPSATGRPIWPYVVVAAVVVVAVAGFFLVRGINAYNKPNPVFPSLADNPDPSLQGTVAYYDIMTSCVRVVAAAGQPSQDVLCLTEEEAYHPTQDAYGPLLAWLPDDRLEVTMRLWGERQAEAEAAGWWQKTVDVTTGQVEEVPATEVPSALPVATASAGPNGEQIEVTSAGGRVEIVLIDAAGSRTLLSTEGNPDYWVKVPPTWSPDGRWIVVEDGASEILLITVDDPAVTRVLATNALSWLGWGGRTHLAVTGAQLLEPED